MVGEWAREGRRLRTLLSAAGSSFSVRGCTAAAAAGTLQFLSRRQLNPSCDSTPYNSSVELELLYCSSCLEHTKVRGKTTSVLSALIVHQVQ